MKDGGELLSYESTSLALNSTNPVTPSAATTPSTQSQAPPDWGVRSQGARRRRGLLPLIRRLIITRDRVGQHSGRDKQHVTIPGVSRLFWVPVSLSGSSARWRRAAAQFVNTKTVS